MRYSKDSPSRSDCSFSLGRKKKKGKKINKAEHIQPRELFNEQLEERKSNKLRVSMIDDNMDPDKQVVDDKGMIDRMCIRSCDNKCIIV